ncbi:MAG: KpsF/GutQ family sugar-phosphate isomerase [Gemmatimonadetes bacterium]|nr:KpsF/GutQ family sugar-phosphate isomerase [Gemmatimonadota bacterium]MBK9549512.1 KpsF/GutQ family sugar-phosphate isomerase [Gemmatimonadota bacterium]MBP9898873.1 KpsF/GutQ family sugar-phosphate isomerase [Gemmatimonadales bacterium]
MRLEAESVTAAAARLDARFERAVELLATGGRVIVSGIGKSGVIAQKIAATLTSTGTSATYLHPIESLHGDLGLVDADSVAIVLSKSGETDELVGLLAELARRAVPLIAIVGAVDSTLGRAATVALDGAVAEEACPHDLAPTTSTTVALALGDALAVALLERKGFRREDFAALHPGGRLGRRLLVRVKDVMVPAEWQLPASASMRQVVVALAKGRGLALIVEGGTLAGVISAGDLTRVADRSADFLELPASDVMTRGPRTAHADELAASVVGLMERHGIVAAPVLDAEQHVVGVVHLHDLLRAGVV